MSRRSRLHVFASVMAFAIGSAAPVFGAEWFVAPGGSGPGSSAAPFGTIQAALDVAQAGDTIHVHPGTYAESLITMRGGTPDRPITLRSSADRGSVVVSVPGRVLTVSHPYLVIDGFVFDGQYGMSDAVKINSTADHLVFRNNEVRRSTRDLIDISAPTGVTIENCLIHHALNAARGRTDAHGIVAGAVQKLTIRESEIHTFSGDGVQVDPGRAVPGWNDVVLENVRIWLEPLPAAENGFAAGVVPGENAIDTKASPKADRARLTLREVTASGFKGGRIGNMAAFNLKEHIEARLDRITVFDSEIAFRLRGRGHEDTGAHVVIMNAVIHDVATAYRYEDDIQQLRIWNNTIGINVARPFQAASSRRAGLDVKNLLVLGARPSEAADSSNLAVTAESFVDSESHDYRLSSNSPAIDRGVDIAAVATDRDGTQRPAGRAYDVGAYEWRPTRNVSMAANNRRTAACELRRGLSLMTKNNVIGLRRLNSSSPAFRS